MSTYEDQEQHYEEEDHVEEEEQHDYYNQQPKEEKKRSSVWVFILLALAVVEAGVIGFLIYSNTEINTQLEAKATEVTEKTKETESKTKELEEMKQQFAELQAENERLGVDNAKLQEDLAQVNQMIEEAKNSNMSVDQIKAKYEKQLKKLRKELALQFQQIKVLKLENAKLTGDVTTLTQEKGKLDDSLKGISSEKAEMAKQLELASVLKAENFTFSALNAKGKEYKGAEFNHNNIAKLKLSFSIADNKIAKKERKALYFALVDASGNVFSDIGNGGGTVTIDGDLKSYTAKMNVDFDNTLQRIALIYEKDSEFGKGRYRVNVYCEGHKIGEGSFLVK
jgi:peptidoglycan hydrolase CwlO-like protein